MEVIIEVIGAFFAELFATGVTEGVSGLSSPKSRLPRWLKIFILALLCLIAGFMAALLAMFCVSGGLDTIAVIALGILIIALISFYIFCIKRIIKVTRTRKPAPTPQYFAPLRQGYALSGDTAENLYGVEVIMMDKAEKKRLKREYREKNKKAFYDSLPMSKELFQQLFEFLDKKLADEGCFNEPIFTIEFLNLNGIPTEPVLSFLEEHGGHCDCEILANGEEYFFDDAIF